MQLRRFFLVIGALAALCPALSAQRKEFMEKELPAIRERMRLLGIDFSTLNETDHA